MEFGSWCLCPFLLFGAMVVWWQIGKAISPPSVGPRRDKDGSSCSGGTSGGGDSGGGCGDGGGGDGGGCGGGCGGGGD